MIKACTVNAVLLFALSVSLPAGADQKGDPLTQLKFCAQIEDSGQRVACYESLGKQVLAEDRGAASGMEVTIQPAFEIAARSTIETGTPVPGDQAVPRNAAVEEGSTATAAVPILSNEIGGDRFSENDAERNRQNRGQVISCQRDHRNKYTFAFGSGQVWRQTDDRRFYSSQGCRFVAIITRDAFGYMMRIDGKKNKIRVKRIR